MSYRDVDDNAVDGNGLAIAEPSYDAEFTDPRNVDGNPRLRRRLRDGFARLAAGDDEDLSDCREDISAG